MSYQPPIILSVKIEFAMKMVITLQMVRNVAKSVMQSEYFIPSKRQEMKKSACVSYNEAH